MLLRVLTLIVFGHVQLGLRSNALPVGDKNYTLTPGIGYHKVHHLAKTWTGARSACQDEGADLAIINSEEEKQVISKLFKLSFSPDSEDSNYVHIGWHDPSRKGHYVTIENETLVAAGFEEWEFNEPNRVGIENCGSVSLNGLLNDIPCEKKLGFVCERPEHVDVKVNVEVEDGIPFLEGGEIIIVCDASGYPNPQLQWYKDDSLIETNNRISISANTLVISAAYQNDTGAYTCNAANGYTSDVGTIAVAVAAPVEVKITVRKGPFLKGSKISIACNAEGFPIPKVLWYKDDILIQPNKRSESSANTLIIPTADENDTGQYSCKAFNKYSSSLHTVDIVVIEPVEVKVEVTKGPFHQGSEISIACKVAGYPMPTVTWYKDGNLIQTNNQIQIAANKLIISAAESNDAGSYSCEATNGYTSGARSVNIIVSALGPNSEGYRSDCDNSTFGCCDDGSTPAHGPNKEGCCLATPYGCCPNNIRHAQAPDLHGCGCQYSKYGCCLDNTTTARGTNNEGCACQHTPYGCCPNQIATATGPDFGGCACHTYQFGCCPDGITIARGPQRQGCGCQNTEFKCCSDGVTPAKGQKYAGCTCGSSKYGCCTDGYEEAQGENFEGCGITIPTTPGAACALEKDRGTCTEFSVRWFFDTDFGDCTRFWYGGCEGNENRFKTQKECKDVCVKPKGRDVCFLPKIAGPCEKFNPMWYYDTERKQCGQFIYKGCHGNANRFETRDECEELCVVPDDVDPCGQDEDVGPCEGNFTQWYFNKESDSCEEFTYGGCEGNKNNFRTQISCQQQCQTAGLSRVLKPGNCPNVSHTTTCEEECSSDADCTDDFKCCANGCGSSCLKPAATEPVTTPAPDVGSFPVLYPGGEPAAIQQPEELTVRAEEGSYIILDCACTGNPRPSITWRKGGILIDNSLDRYTISVDGSLRIVNLYRTDAGIYTCTADNRLAAPVGIQYELDVTEGLQRPPDILGEPDYHVTVTLNSPAVLPCNAIGWPRPSVTWWHEELLLPISGGLYQLQRDNSLKINRVDLVNLGVYTCQDYNGIQGPMSWSVTLQAPGPVYNLSPENQKYTKYLVESPRRPVSSTVKPQYPYRPVTTTAPQTRTYEPSHPDWGPHTPPSVREPDPEIVRGIRIVPVTVNVSTDSHQLPERSEFNISCHVDGFPVPRVAWFKDDTPIQPNNRIMISSGNNLFISDADKSDSGRYRCQAGNEYSIAADAIDIQVDGIYIHPNCRDTLFYANCSLIVKAKFCNHKYYARLCCRSCVEAGMLPARGSHINETRRKRRSILSSL